MIMTQPHHKSKNKAAADRAKEGRRDLGSTNGKESSKADQRDASDDDMRPGRPPFIDVFHYKPTLNCTDYHLFQKLRFYVLQNHSFGRRAELGYVRLADMVFCTEPLPHPVELSCGVFACMEQRLDRKGNSQRYPDQSVVRRALDTGKFLRCIDFREYIGTMWLAENSFWFEHVKGSKGSPVQPSIQRIYQTSMEPVGIKDTSDQTERLALTGRSYADDAGQRLSLLLTPDLPEVITGRLVGELHLLLERTFEMYLAVSEQLELPQTPQTPPQPAGQHVSEDDDASSSSTTQSMVSSIEEDWSDSSSGCFDCHCTSCSGLTPAMSSAASPVASPATSPAASSAVSPAASSAVSPAASPAASPPAFPVASPATPPAASPDPAAATEQAVLAAGEGATSAETPSPEQEHPDRDSSPGSWFGPSTPEQGQLVELNPDFVVMTLRLLEEELDEHEPCERQTTLCPTS